jgi:hypothetical protein
MPSSAACELTETLPREFVDPAPPMAEHVAQPTARAALLLRVRRQAARSVVQFIAGALLLGTLLAVGFAWRAKPSPRPIATLDETTSTRPSPEPATMATLPSSGASASQTTAPSATPEPLAPSPVPTEPQGPRASAAPLPRPGAPDRGSAGDLLDRARRARRAGRIDDAAALFAAAVEQAPSDSEALTGLAEVDDARGATAKAIAVYRRALAVNPGYLPARLGLADSLWTNGQRDEARTAYGSIVEHFPRALYPDRARERAGTAGRGTTPN